jgi:hypothetical protein
MTEDEQKLLRTASEAVMQLLRDRDAMAAGFTAVFLDLYQVEFQKGRQTKAEALSRLQVQRDRLAQHSARASGAKFLDSLIQTVEKAQPQPAKPAGGRQLQLRDVRPQHGSGETGYESKASEANGESVHRILASGKSAFIKQLHSYVRGKDAGR